MKTDMQLFYSVGIELYTRHKGFEDRGFVGNRGNFMLIGLKISHRSKQQNVACALYLQIGLYKSLIVSCS